MLGPVWRAWARIVGEARYWQQIPRPTERTDCSAPHEELQLANRRLAEAAREVPTREPRDAEQQPQPTASECRVDRVQPELAHGGKDRAIASGRARSCGPDGFDRILSDGSARHARAALLSLATDAEITLDDEADVDAVLRQYG